MSWSARRRRSRQRSWRRRPHERLVHSLTSATSCRARFGDHVGCRAGCPSGLRPVPTPSIAAMSAPPATDVTTASRPRQRSSAAWRLRTRADPARRVQPLPVCFSRRSSSSSRTSISSSSPSCPGRARTQRRTRPSAAAPREAPVRDRRERHFPPQAPLRRPGFPAPCRSPRRRGRGAVPRTGPDHELPSPTWTTMFRAISETAVAIRVASVREKPSQSRRAPRRAR